MYAYRVCEIHYGKDVYVAPYNKGDTFSDNPEVGDRESSDDEDEGQEQQRIMVEKIDTSDYSGLGVAHQFFNLTLPEEEEEEFFLPG